MASSDTSGKRTCGNIHNGISILLEVQSSSFQTICPFPLRVLPFASGSRSTVCCLPLRIEARSKLSLPLTLPLSILFFPYFSSSNSFFLPAVLPWNRNSSARRKIERKIRRSFPCPITLLSSLFCSNFLTRNEYFPPLFFFLLLMFIQCSRKFLRATTKPSPRNYSRNAKTLVVSRGLSHRSRTIGRRETRTECNRRAQGEIIVSFHPIPIILSLVYGGLLISRDERAIHPKGIQRLDRGFKERLSRNRTNLSRGQPDDSNGESKLSRSKEN